jgi:hypothetical protein
LFYRTFLLLIRVWLTCSVFGLSVEHSWAWTGDAHAAIARAGFRQLTPVQQQHFQKLLAIGPWVKPGMTDQQILAEAIAWPDKIRMLSLKNIMLRYGSGEVPKDLQSFAKLSTQDWHYSNLLFITPEGKSVNTGTGKLGICQPRPNGRLLTVWPALIQAYQNADNPKDKAVLLAFILHLLTDAYQPLHLVASVNKSCDQDRGGNLYCTSPRTGFAAASPKIPNKKCKNNLHSLWDKGFGVFKTELKNNQTFSGEALSLSPALKEVSSHAESIYPTTPTDITLPIYQRKTRATIDKLANQASAHLHQLLVGLDKENNK